MSDFVRGLSITVSDTIAIVSALIAFLSAIYARHSRDAARRANNIAVHNNLRPSRLEVYRSMRDFAHYCCTYPTDWHSNPVPTAGTINLMERIGNFKWEIEQQGPLAMPVVENKIKEMLNNAWKIQRLLDRLAAGRNDPHDRDYETAEDNLDAIVDWFANEQKDLKTIFNPYLLAGIDEH